MKRLRREIIIFTGLFLFLTLTFHFKAWLDHPIRHLEALPTSPMGLWHPLYLTLAVYFLILVIRIVFQFVKRFFKS